MTSSWQKQILKQFIPVEYHIVTLPHLYMNMKKLRPAYLYPMAKFGALLIARWIYIIAKESYIFEIKQSGAEQWISCLMCTYLPYHVNAGKKWTFTFNLSRPNGAYVRKRIRLSLVKIMACRLSMPSRYLNKCWLVVNKVHANKFKWKLDQIMHSAFIYIAFVKTVCKCRLWLSCSGHI